MLVCTSIFANDVITLKDGRVIEGQVYRTLDNGDLCVQKLDGNYILVSKADILTHTQSLTPSQDNTTDATPPNEFWELHGPFTSGLAKLGMKGSYVHGFDSKSVFCYDDFEEITEMKNGNGFNIGIAVTMDLNRHFFFEVGVNLTFLNYRLENKKLLWSTSVDYFGIEIPFQVGYRIVIKENYECRFQVGPTYKEYWQMPRSGLKASGTNTRLGVQADLGVKIRNNYMGIGFNLGCFADAENVSMSNYWLDDTRNYLQLTYGYFF